MSFLLVVYRPHKQRAVRSPLHAGDRERNPTAREALPSFGGVGGGFYFHLRHHSWQQLAVTIGHVDANVIGVCHRIGHHSFLYTSAADLLACGLDDDHRRRVGRDGIHLGFRHRHLYFYARHIENGHHSLRGHSCLAGLHLLTTDDAAHRSHQPTVGEVLLGNGQLRPRLCHLALYLHPLHLGQRTGIVQHAIALQGVFGLCHLRLGTRQQVASLRVVHQCQELSTTDGLSFPHEHTLHNTHARETHGCRFVLLDDAHIALIRHLAASRHHFGFHLRGGFLPILFLVAAGATENNDSQQQKYLYLFHRLADSSSKFCSLSVFSSIIFCSSFICCSAIFFTMRPAFHTITPPSNSAAP